MKLLKTDDPDRIRLVHPSAGMLFARYGMLLACVAIGGYLALPTIVQLESRFVALAVICSVIVVGFLGASVLLSSIDIVIHRRMGKVVVTGCGLRKTIQGYELADFSSVSVETSGRSNVVALCGKDRTLKLGSGASRRDALELASQVAGFLGMKLEVQGMFAVADVVSAVPSSGPVLNLIVLRASDIEKSAAFYRDVGLSFTKHAHGSGPEHFASESSGAVLELYPATANQPVSASTRIGFSVGDVDAVVNALVAAGAKVVTAAADSEWGRRAVVADPDGHRVELVQRSA
jgi:lactoylglutathione lyase